MLPAKNTAYQNFSAPDCDPAKLRTIGNTAAQIVPTSASAPAPAAMPAKNLGEEAQCVAISFGIADEADALQARKDLLSMVSHDLRSPLTSLRVSVGMFLGGAFGEMNAEATKRLESMGASVDLLIRMINDLLDVERLEAGYLKFNVKTVDTHDLLKMAIQAVSGIAEAKRIDIKVVGNRLNIAADPDRVIQVLINLLSNSIKFSPVNSTIEVRVSGLRNGSTEFRVIDQGRGIPAAKLSSIFNPYVQAGTHADVEKLGSGLGLTIAKKIVEAHGGTIGVCSEVGKGSQFWFRLRAQK